MNNIFHYLVPWEPSPTFAVVIIATCTIYLRGLAEVKISFLRLIGFWCGMILIYIVLQTQYDYYSEHEFFMHRLQHSVLHHTAPFLIALSRPGAVFAAGMPKRLLQVLEPVIKLADNLNRPLIAPIIFCGLILFWLIPQFHFIAMLDWRMYRVMNWSMAINGLMFWSVVLNRKTISPVTRIVMMLAVIPPQIVIGALIFFAPRELYPIYTICGRAFGISALADQQIGGLILWIPAAMMSVIGVLVVVKGEIFNSRLRASS